MAEPRFEDAMKRHKAQDYDPETNEVLDIKGALLSERNNISALMRDQLKTLDTLCLNPECIVFVDNTPVFDPFSDEKGDVRVGNIGVYQEIKGRFFGPPHSGIAIGLQPGTHAEVRYDTRGKEGHLNFVDDGNDRYVPEVPGIDIYTAVIFGKSIVTVAKKVGGEYNLDTIKKSFKPYNIDATTFVEEMNKHKSICA